MSSFDKKKPAGFKIENDKKVIKKGSKERKERRKKIGCKFALTMSLLLPGRAFALGEYCTTPPEKAVEITRGWCHDNAECIYLRMREWLTCSENFNWQLAWKKENKKRIDSNTLLGAFDEALYSANENIRVLEKRIQRLRNRLKSNK